MWSLLYLQATAHTNHQATAHTNHQATAHTNHQAAAHTNHQATASALLLQLLEQLQLRQCYSQQLQYYSSTQPAATATAVLQWEGRAIKLLEERQACSSQILSICQTQPK